MATDLPVAAPPLPATSISADAHQRLAPWQAKGPAQDCVVSNQLEELVAALDRRQPRADRPGEAAIALDAAALRAKAIDRLTQLATRPAICAAGNPDARK